MFHRDDSVRALLSRYLRTGFVVLVAVVARAALEPTLGNAGFTIFLGAILLGAWVGGVGPSLLGQTILLFVHAYWFAVGPVPPPEGITVRGVVSICAFFSVGTVVAVMSEARLAAMKRVRLQNEHMDQQREELRTIISAIGDAVVVSDRHGDVSYMNPMAERMTQWSSKEAEGRSLEELFQIREPGVEHVPIHPLEQPLSQGRSVREGRILLLRLRDGRQTPVTFNSTPLRSATGKITGAVLVVRDESERCRAEKQLRDMNSRKDDFIATLAHELRNPLAPIRTGLQLLKLSKADPLITNEVEEIMDRQVQHIVRLVDDLLDVSRISRGKLQLRLSPTNVSRVVAHALETMRPQIEAAGHQLIVDLPDGGDPLDADPDRLTQITCNLLHNAIKFTPHGGRIEVRLENGADEVSLMVKDNGAGIESYELESIFEMFNQGLREKEHGKSGLGVGLTLALRLAEMHGGTIEADSPGRNQGSTFRLRLPVCRRFAEVEHGWNRPVRQAAPRSRQVLIVDDNEDGLRTMEMMVRALGSSVQVARNGLEALAVAERYRPDIIFMDLGMPVLNGHEAARQLRQTPWGRDILLIAVTGWGQEKDRIRTGESGFDDHLVKPIELEALRGCLERSDRRVHEPLELGDTA